MYQHLRKLNCRKFGPSQNAFLMGLFIRSLNRSLRLLLQEKASIAENEAQNQNTTERQVLRVPRQSFALLQQSLWSLMNQKAVQYKYAKFSSKFMLFVCFSPLESLRCIHKYLLMNWGSLFKLGYSESGSFYELGFSPSLLLQQRREQYAFHIQSFCQVRYLCWVIFKNSLQKSHFTLLLYLFFQTFKT